MSYAMETRVIKCKGLSVKAKLVLRSLARWAREEDEDGVDIDKDGRLWDVKVGWCWPGQARLVDETEYAKSTIQLALEELIGKGIVTIIRGGGQFKVGGSEVRLSNVYCVDMDKAELIRSRDPWEHKKKVKGGSGKSKEERALDARTRIFERHQKESERRASLEGIAPLEPIKPTAKTDAASDVSPAQKPPAQSASKPAAKTEKSSTKSNVKSVTYEESVEIYTKVAAADGSTIDDLAPLLGYAATSKLGLPRNVALTSEQWLAVCQEQFPKLVWTMGAPVDQKPATPAKPKDAQPAKKSTPPRSEDSDLLAKTFFEDVLDSKKSRTSQLPVWSMVFFEEKLSRQDGLHLIRCAGAWGWKEHIQKLKSDPVEFLLENKVAIYDDYVDSDFFDPEAEDTGEPPAGWHPGDDSDSDEDEFAGLAGIE